ncbi:MAG TPA: amidohydrolase [Candidatus Saccharimonadales bacterium]|nr:amidohydrolase [Candidatus Saccharimonadales bacterium]
MPADRPADLVLRGGRIATMDAARRFATALAVHDGRLLTVGTDEAVRPHIGPSTRVIELRGRTVTPGFQDAHVHPVHGGLARLRCELHDQRGEATYLAIIERYARTHPDEAWIRGGGWAMDDFPGGSPTKAGLDRIVPDRPVLLSSRDGHTAWANSRALEIGGIDASTQDPSDGRIEREADGSPAGALHEGAIDLVERHQPDDTPADLEEALRIGQAYLHSLGVTAWQDAIVSPGTEERAYVALASSGELTARVVGAMWWERHRGAEQIEEFVARREATSIGRYRATSVKLMMDGVLENFTGAMLEPYGDGHGGLTDNRGLSQIDPEGLKTWVPQLDALGFQPHFHAIGDRAVRESLDAVAAARAANGVSDTRPHIAHIQVIHPDDITRFHSLDVAANAQPFWAVHDGQMDNLTIPFLGDRWRWQYPFRSLRAAGAVLAMGSDWSVSTPDPLAEMAVAVDRLYGDHEAGDRPFLPDEAIELIDALAAFTVGSAYVNHLDDETGTLEIGKAADLVVLDRDLFDRAAGGIADARVLGTFIDGRPVYEAGGLDA